MLRECGGKNYGFFISCFVLKREKQNNKAKEDFHYGYNYYLCAQK